MKFRLVQRSLYNKKIEFYADGDEVIYFSIRQLELAFNDSTLGEKLEKIVQAFPFLRDEAFVIIPQLVTEDGEVYEKILFTKKGVYEALMLTDEFSYLGLREFISEVEEGVENYSFDNERVISVILDSIEQAKAYMNKLLKEREEEKQITIDNCNELCYYINKSYLENRY